MRHKCHRCSFRNEKFLLARFLQRYGEPITTLICLMVSGTFLLTFGHRQIFKSRKEIPSILKGFQVQKTKYPRTTPTPLIPATCKSPNDHDQRENSRRFSMSLASDPTRRGHPDGSIEALRHKDSILCHHFNWSVTKFFKISEFRQSTFSSLRIKIHMFKLRV